MSEALKELGAHIELKRPDCVLSYDIANGELTIVVTPANFVSFVEFLKSDATCRFSTLVDITAVDFPARDARFDVVYHFLSMYQNHRVRVKFEVREQDMIPTSGPVPTNSIPRAGRRSPSPAPSFPSPWDRDDASVEAIAGSPYPRS